MSNTSCLVQGCKTHTVGGVKVWLAEYYRYDTFNFCTAHVDYVHRYTRCKGLHGEQCPGDRLRDSRYSPYCSPCRTSNNYKVSFEDLKKYNE